MVEDGGPLVAAVGPLGDLGPEAFFGIVQGVLNAVVDDLAAVLGKQGLNALFGQITRPEHGRQISPQHLRNARVGQDPVQDILAQLPPSQTVLMGGMRRASCQISLASGL